MAGGGERMGPREATLAVPDARTEPFAGRGAPVSVRFEFASDDADAPDALVFGLPGGGGIVEVRQRRR